MRRVVPTIACVLWLLGTGLVSAQAPPPSPAPARPVFPTAVSGVRLDVVATRDGKPLPGLTAADFEVLDEGTPQSIELESVGGPVHAILLLDTSGSVAGERLDHLKAAARAFVEGLGPEDHTTLLTFSHELRLAAPPSAERATLLRALDDTRASGATALNDAVFASLQLADPTLGRTVVLVFSDGEDVLSWLEPARLREAARRSEASVYAVALTDAPARGGRDAPGYLPETEFRNAGGGPTRERPHQELPTNVYRPASQPGAPHDLPALLRDLASDSGGQVWRAEGGPQLRAAFLQALAEMKSRYLLRFEPTSRKPGWHALEVKLRGRKGDLRARKGYFATAP